MEPFAKLLVGLISLNYVKFLEVKVLIFPRAKQPF